MKPKKKTFVVKIYWKTLSKNSNHQTEIIVDIKAEMKREKIIKFNVDDGEWRLPIGNYYKESKNSQLSALKNSNKIETSHRSFRIFFYN